MKNLINKFSFWLSILAILLTLSTIFVMIMDVWEISVVDSDSFISGLVALMSLVFTLLVGYQIYNAIDAREKIDRMQNELNRINEFRGDIDKIRAELSSDIKSNSATLKALVEEAKDNNTKTENRLNEGILILLARMCAAKPIMSQNAFLKMLGAIRCALDIDHKEDGYGWMLKELEEYMLMLNNRYPFSGSSDEIPQKVQAYKDIYKEDDDLIRKHKNYYLIKDMYEPLMGKFDIRLKLISQMKPVSLTEVDKAFEH